MYRLIGLLTLSFAEVQVVLRAVLGSDFDIGYFYHR